MSSKNVGDWETFRRNLFLFLKRRGLSQAEFARRINISRGTVNQWLTGAKRPTRDQLFVIAEFHGSGFDRLFGWVPPGAGPIVAAHRRLKNLAEGLGRLLPEDWDKSELAAWEKYEAKQRRAAATRPARAQAPGKRKKSPSPKKTRRKR